MTIQDFDDVLDIVGSYGRYQKWITALVIIPTSFFISITISVWVFVTVIPNEYWCNAPGRDLTRHTQKEWTDLTIPKYNNGTLEKCKRYKFNVEKGEVLIDYEGLVEDCVEYNHKRTQFQETLATSKGWLCEKELYSTHILSIHMASNALGTFILPIVADKFTGRRIMFYIAIGLHLIFTLPILFISNYGLILASRFFAGLAFQTNYQMAFIIGIELMSPEKRALTSFFSFVAWTFGMCATAFLAWVIPHWWYLVLFSCVPSLIFFSFWWYLPESPRWLLAHKRIEECTDIVINIAKWNRKRISPELLRKELGSLSAKKEEHVSFREIIHYPKLTLNALFLILLSFTAFVGYGCLILKVNIIPDNYFLGYFVLSLSELPSNIMGWMSCHYLGRRFTAVVTPLLTLPFSIAAALTLDNPIALLGIVSIIKIFFTEIIFIIYLLSSEIFPTPIRSTGMGVVILCGMIGIVIAPYILTVGNGFEYWVMVGLSIGMFFFSFFLPETIGLPLPQTFSEANSIGKDRSLFRWIHHWNREKYIHVYQENVKDETEVDAASIPMIKKE